MKSNILKNKIAKFENVIMEFINPRLFRLKIYDSTILIDEDLVQVHSFTMQGGLFLIDYTRLSVRQTIIIGKYGVSL